MKLKIELSPEAQRLARSLKELPARVLGRLRGEMDTQNELTVGHIQEARLSHRGPETLGVVTGRLRRSINPSRAVLKGKTIQSAIGSNVHYLAPHEFGFDGTVSVRAHFRHVKGRTVRGPRRKVLARGVGLWRAHSRHVVIPARAPIWRGVMDRESEYSDALSDAVIDELRDV